MRTNVKIFIICCLYSVAVFSYVFFTVKNRLASMKIPPERILQPKWPYIVNSDTLLDLYDFKFIMNNASLCIGSVNAPINRRSSIAIMVHTSRPNYNRRYAIRNTWGSLKMLKGWHLHLVFLLGSGIETNPKLEAQLNYESKEHGDMIMGNFADSYNNVTYKHLMGYKWVSIFCPTAKFILKTDDNIFTDIFQVVDVLLEKLIGSQKTFVCLNMGGTSPIRDPKSPWYVSEYLYSEDKYPDYCSGSAYLMIADDATKIYSVNNMVKFLWVDDVFVTGILREKYDLLVTKRNISSLEILSFYDKHYLGDTEEKIAWCNKDLQGSQINYTFILLKENNFVNKMFCIWNKVRLM